MGFLKTQTQTQPYSLLDRVKPDLLGLGQAEYPQVRQKLPSLRGRNSLFTYSQIRLKKEKRKKKPTVKDDLATQKSIGGYWIQLKPAKGDDSHKLMVEIKNFKN